MVLYEAHIKHTEETLTALAHMQYDLFCTGNRIGRTAVAAGLFVFGALNYTQWWGPVSYTHLTLPTICSV